MQGPCRFISGRQLRSPFRSCVSRNSGRAEAGRVTEPGGSLPQIGPQATPKDDSPLRPRLKIHQRGMTQ